MADLEELAGRVTRRILISAEEHALLIRARNDPDNLAKCLRTHRIVPVRIRLEQLPETVDA